MKQIFLIVYLFLVWLSKVTGLTYAEINIIAYYFIIPMIYIIMIDKIIGRHILKISYSIFCILVLLFTDFESFSNWLFKWSVDFLLSFSILGWNYTVASVIICVFILMAVFIVLFKYSYWPILKNKIF